MTLEVTDDALRFIAAQGFDPVYGARPLRRFIVRDAETIIRRALLSGDMPDGSAVTVDVQEGEIFVGHEQLASLAVDEGAARNHSDSAAKAGLVALVRSAAVELARQRIRVNAVLPGWIASDMSARAERSQAFTDSVISRVPIGRWGRPEELAGVAVYLASDAAGYQTGTSVVDGGYSILNPEDRYGDRRRPRR
jgi:NAD(P)-dependent dehydrogenase (short-subunit alcohol dehydrogenase family)